MSTEIRPLHLPLPPKHPEKKILMEVPTGERLLGKTLTAVNTALQETIPFTFHPQLILVPERIEFSESIEKLIEKEEEERAPKSQYVYAGLSKAGVPSQVLDALFFYVKPSVLVPIYWSQSDNQKPTIYLTKDVKDDLSKNSQERLYVAALLGTRLIEETFLRLPTPLELTTIPWREIIRNNMDYVFDTILEQSKIQEECYHSFNRNTLDSFKEDVNRLLNDKSTRFVACGSEVHVLFPGQDIKTSDFIIGANFNSEIVSIVSMTIMKRFMKLMGLKPDRRIATEPERISRVKKILSTLTKETGLPVNTTQVFLDSLIPNYYSLLSKKISFGNQKIADPWTYPY